MCVIIATIVYKCFSVQFLLSFYQGHFVAGSMVARVV